MLRNSLLLRKLLPCLLIFELLGTPIVIPKCKGPVKHIIISFYGVFVYFILLSLILCSFYIFLESIQRRFNDGNNLSVHVHLVIISGLLTEALIAIIFSIFSSKAQLNLLREFEFVDQLVINFLSVEIDYEKLRNSLIVKCIGSMVVFVTGSLSALVFASLLSPSQIPIFALVFWPFTIKRVVGVKYMFYIEILNFYLDILQENLAVFIRRVRVHRGLRISKPFIGWTMSSHQCYLRLLMTRKIYGELHKISNHIKRIFGPYLVLISTMVFVTSIYCGYNFCVSLSRKTNNYRLIGEVIFLTYMGIILTFPGERSKKKV